MGMSKLFAHTLHLPYKKCRYEVLLTDLIIFIGFYL